MAEKRKKLVKTSTPGIYRRHVKDCPNYEGKGRCKCPYVVPKRHRGRQHFETFPSFDLAKEARGRKDAGNTRPKSKQTFGSYFETWIETYAGRTKKGFDESTRVEYRRSIETDVLPRWRSLRLGDIDQEDVAKLYEAMAKAGRSHATMRRSALHFRRCSTRRLKDA